MMLLNACFQKAGLREREEKPVGDVSHESGIWTELLFFSCRNSLAGEYHHCVHVKIKCQQSL
jgi:hypothetical protein